MFPSLTDELQFNGGKICKMVKISWFQHHQHLLPKGSIHIYDYESLAFISMPNQHPFASFGILPPICNLEQTCFHTQKQLYTVT